MILTGQTVENPVTGERLVFHKTARETRGEYVQFEAFIRPGGTLAAHVHPSQTERFEVVSGTLTMKVGRRTFEAKPGDVVVIEPGTPHNFWNRSDDEVGFLVEVRPALAPESLIDALYTSLAADGKTNRWGVPSSFRPAAALRWIVSLCRKLLAQSHELRAERRRRSARTFAQASMPRIAWLAQ